MRKVLFAFGLILYSYSISAQESYVTEEKKEDSKLVIPIPVNFWSSCTNGIYYNGGLALPKSEKAVSRNVGIGTSNPLQKLHVNGNIRGNQAGGALRIQTSYGYTDIGAKNSSWSHFYTDRARYYFDKEIRVDQGLIGSYNENLQLRTSGTTRMTLLNSNGNVGIGKSNPTKKLDVNGDINFTGNLYKNGAIVNTGGTGGSSLWTIVENASGDDGANIQNALNSNSYVSLRPNTTYNISQRISIPANKTLQIPSGCILLFDENSGSQAAVEMVSYGTLIGDGTIKLNRADWNMADEKIGVLISGHNNKIEFGTVQGFEIGFYMSSWVRGVGWNNVNVRYVYDCVIGLVMYKNGVNAWINQNFFHVDKMGEHRTSSESDEKATWDQYSIGIKMDNYGNTNMFSGSIEGYNVGIQLMGKYNRIESVRLEACKTKVRLVGTAGGNAGTEHNYLYSPYGEIAGLTTSSGGDMPIVNDTGKPLYEVLNVFGFDQYTYLHKLYKQGSFTLSDSRLKNEISDVEGALNKVLALRGTTYKMKSDEKDNKKDTLKEYGFIAQELKEVLPELVEKNPLDGMYAINYEGVIPVLIEAFKEQQELIDKRDQEVAELLEMNQKLVEILQSKGILSEGELDMELEAPILYQNVPNPFNSLTEIEYFLPYDFSNAYIYITDMNGKYVKKVDVYTKGRNKVSISSNELNSGMYIYSLIADDKVVGTKRMILTE